MSVDDYLFDNESAESIACPIPPGPDDDGYDELQACLYHAWHEWSGHMREQGSRHSRKPGWGHWRERQRGRFCSMLRKRYGQELPDRCWLQSRRNKLESMGRFDDAKAMDERQPWE